MKVRRNSSLFSMTIINPVIFIFCMSMLQLLGWMHRKLRQNSTEPFKELTTGNSYGCLPIQPSLYEQEYYPKPTFSCEESPTELKTKRLEEVSEEEWSTMITAPFDGFLMIGTLGLEQILTEPSTPTFPMPSEKITEENAEVTENELKFINDELEKFLEAEAKEVGDEPSERSSYVSIITICGKQIEGVDNEEYEDNGECPLQEYLFGSSIELPEPNMQVEKERTSLGQLFKMNNIAHDHSTSKCEKIKNHARGTYAMRFIRKMLKKLHSSPPPRSSTGTGGATADPPSTKRKLPKILRMFHKKIHPERANAEEELKKSRNCESNKNSIAGGCNKGGLPSQDNYKSRSRLRAIFKKETTSLNVTHTGLSSSGMNEKREHWIKTDADYLVLEL
ncbi:hypothetical protein RHMOL_Rhmol08G0050300 [Rhododendron molle]|uniref:Uncharacterized protein n=1 Tax=Rhododendron molle TaxID=49168 RepID=A0ACC0MK90_RHOML|nr:hypothetical protein RHMOL_Rhmol08G0050300 [Rhododendron molle]